MQTMTSMSPDAHVGEHSEHTPGHRHRQRFYSTAAVACKLSAPPHTPAGPSLANHFPLVREGLGEPSFPCAATNHYARTTAGGEAYGGPEPGAGKRPRSGRLGLPGPPRLAA